EQRECERCGECEEELQCLDLQGVGERRGEVRIGEQAPEILEADPWTPLEPKKRRVVLERDDISQQWEVDEDEEIQDARKEEHVHPAVAPEPLEHGGSPAPVGWAGLRRTSRG